MQTKRLSIFFLANDLHSLIFCNFRCLLPVLSSFFRSKLHVSVLITKTKLKSIKNFLLKINFIPAILFAVFFPDFLQLPDESHLFFRGFLFLHIVVAHFS